MAQSEELRHEIAEIAESFMRLAQRVHTPLSASLGTAAARLEQSLTAASASSYALRDILVRTGSSLPEQEVQFFSTGLEVDIPKSAPGSAQDHGSDHRIVLSLGQLLDWIIDVAEPYVATTNRSERLEQSDFVILADELDRQVMAIRAIASEGNRLGFAFRLPGPMRQIEELGFHIKASARLARELASPTGRSDQTGGRDDD